MVPANPARVRQPVMLSIDRAVRCTLLLAVDRERRVYASAGYCSRSNLRAADGSLLRGSATRSRSELSLIGVKHLDSCLGQSPRQRLSSLSNSLWRRGVSGALGYLRKSKSFQTL